MDNRNDGEETQPTERHRPGSAHRKGKRSRLPLISGHDGLVRLQRWVAENDPVTLTLRQAATIASLEPHYFSRVFRECVGETFHTNKPNSETSRIR